MNENIQKRAQATDGFPSKSNEIRYSKRSQQFIFFPLQEKNQIFIHIEEKPLIQKILSKVTSTNQNRMSNLSQIKEYKVLKAKKQAKKMSEAFQIKSINLIKKFNIEKENKEFKLPREVSDNVQFPKNRKNELKMGKPEKPRFSNLKKECANLCVTTTPFFKKTLTSQNKLQIMKDKFDFKLEMVFRNIEELRNYHGLQQKKSEYEKKQFIKAHVGKGNNAGLVKELIRKRWWWAVSQEKIDCKLIWSQSKDKNFYLNLNDSLHNHFFYNEQLGSKKELLLNMKKYYEKSGKDPFSYLPLTFEVHGFEDEGWKSFIKEFKKKQENETQAWILKPGENSNRGNGITIHNSLEDIEGLLKKAFSDKKEKNCNFIIQQYIDRPFLYNKRKFDLRCYMLIVKLGKSVRCYWCRQGYIRTSSYEFKVGDYSNTYIHLTNDAIQFHCQDYGKYEEGNKLTFHAFQKYLDSKYNFKYDFKREVYPLLKNMALDAIKASLNRLGTKHASPVFELFGLDFMIDQNFKPWLIEVNTNPSIQTSSFLQRKLIPRILDDAFKLSIDVSFPPPENWPNSKKHLLPSVSNSFQLFYTHDLNKRIEQ